MRRNGLEDAMLRRLLWHLAALGKFQSLAVPSSGGRPQTAAQALLGAVLLHSLQLPPFRAMLPAPQSLHPAYNLRLQPLRCSPIPPHQECVGPQGCLNQS